MDLQCYKRSSFFDDRFWDFHRFNLPFLYENILKLPAQKVLNITFFSMCILAGFLVGVFNFSIFRVIVCSFLKELRNKIKDFREKLKFITREKAKNLNPKNAVLVSILRM